LTTLPTINFTYKQPITMVQDTNKKFHIWFHPRWLLSSG